MSFRFRRSIKLGKGVRLNLSKKGIGMSIGKRGLRYSVHSTGRRTKTLGIPGTGLSYVKTSTKSKNARNHLSESQKRNNNIEQNIAIVEQYNDYIYAIQNLHQEMPDEIDWTEIQTIPAPFSPNGIGPLESKAIESYQNYSPSLLGKIFKNIAERERNQLQQAIKKAKQQDQSDYREWKELRDLAYNVLQGDKKSYKEVIQDIKAFEKIKEPGLQVRTIDTRTLEIEFGLDLDEIVPKKTLTLTKTGKVSKRKMGKTKYYEILKDHVCSYAISVAQHIFAYLPVNRCIVHVKNKTLNTATGYEEEIVILSIIFDRKTFYQLNFKRIKPSDTMKKFYHHMEHLKTKGFRKVIRISGK